MAVIRVLLLSWEYPPNILGGLGRHVYELSASLCKMGIEVWVVTRGKDTDPYYDTTFGVNVVRVSLPNINFDDLLKGVMSYNAEFVRASMDIAKEIGPFDIIHAHDWLVAYASIMLKNSTQVPLISTIHATEWGRNRGIHTDLQRFISSIEWHLTYESMYVICCSRYMLSELTNIFNLPADKVRVIPNGVSVVGVKETIPESVRSLSDLFVSDRNSIFFIGRLVYEKGIELLVRAFNEVLKTHGNSCLLMAGEGPERTRLQPVLDEMGISDKVIFLGFIDDATRAYLLRNVSVAVFPSLYEPFGIVALETLSSECPIIVSDVGGLGEIIENGINGYKCKPNNVHVLAKTIISTLNRPRRSKKMARSGFKDVVEFYNWTSISSRTLEVYNEAVSWSENENWDKPLIQVCDPVLSGWI